MKTALDFTLDPRRFFNVWILFYVLVLLPYGYYTISFRLGEEYALRPTFGLLLFLGILLAGIIMYFYLSRIFIEHVKVGEKRLQFQGEIGEYLGRAISGFLLTMLTMALYLAWFFRDMVRFFVNGSQLDGDFFHFQGNVHRLFVILLLSLFLPIIILTVLTLRIPEEILGTGWFMLGQQAIHMLVMIPYMFFVYDWMMNIKYKDYLIYWDTNYREALPVLFREMLLGILTLGIYMPMAWLKLYQFFVGRTVAEREGYFRRFEYEMEAGEDFGFMWIQILLFVGTLGLYGPWAVTRIGKRLLSKTYLLPEEAIAPV